MAKFLKYNSGLWVTRGPGSTCGVLVGNVLKYHFTCELLEQSSKYEFTFYLLLKPKYGVRSAFRSDITSDPCFLMVLFNLWKQSRSEGPEPVASVLSCTRSLRLLHLFFILVSLPYEQRTLLASLLTRSKGLTTRNKKLVETISNLSKERLEF